MFEKFKEEDDVKVAAAVLLHDIIISDNKISSVEVEKFHMIFTTGFNISKEDSTSLYNQSVSLEGEFELHLQKIKKKLNSDPMAKMNLMKALNEMILVDGIVDIEYDRFELIKNELL